MNTAIIRITVIAALLSVLCLTAQAQEALPPNNLSSEQIQQILNTEGLDSGKVAELLGNMSNKTLAEQITVIMSSADLTPQQRTAVIAAITNGTAPVRQKTAKQPTGNGEAKKTLVDVLDKALDLTSGMVAKVSKNLETYAPKVWGIMIKQQYANAIADAILPFILVLVSIGFILYSRGIPETGGGGIPRWKELDGNDGDEVAPWFIARLAPILCVIAFSIWLVAEIALSTKLLINPEFYAIQDLMKIFLTKGGSL